MTPDEVLDLLADVRRRHTFTGQPDRMRSGTWWRPCQECGQLVFRHATAYSRHQDQVFADALVERITPKGVTT